MTYNPDIHHRRSIRLKEYDYSGVGAYYVTLRAFQRECLFGDIVIGEMRLNDIGLIVRECWQRIPVHFPGLEVDEFVVMPNHFHAILLITESVGPIHVGAKQVSPASPAFGRHIVKQGVSMPQGTSPGSLGAIMQNFKSVSTRKINKLRDNPGCPVWQRNYYERVIWDEKELTMAREYVLNNPLQWDLDNDNPKRIQEKKNM